MNNKLRIAFLIFFALIFIVSSAMLVKIFLDYKKDDDYYESLQAEYEKTSDSESKTESESETEPVPEVAKHPEHEFENPDLGFMHTQFSYVLVPSFNSDMVELRKMNPDIVGWINMPDTEINYPLLLGENNDSYIRTGPDGKPHNAGSIFLDYRCPGDFTGKNTIIYGHNQKNHKMFHDLYKYMDPDFALEHPYFTIRYADGTEGKYEVFCSTQISAYAYAYHINFTDDDTFYEHLRQLVRDSKINYGVQVNAQDYIVTLSTCTNVENDDRIIVVARKIQ